MDTKAVIFNQLMQFLILFFSFHCAEAGIISPLNSEQHQHMHGSTWHWGCPVSLHDLSMVQVPYWGMDHKPHQGTLIVHHRVASEIVEIFKEIYEQHFPIASMIFVDDLHKKKRRLIEGKNTVAFNCRRMVGAPWLFSQHSFGWAIDINPHLNPYIKGRHITPENAKAYVDRNQRIPGMIHKNDPVYRAFIKRGWQWGGEWLEVKDYMHFEKPLEVGFLRFNRT